MQSQSPHGAQPPSEERPGSLAGERARVEIKLCALIVQRNLREAVELADKGDERGASIHRDLAALASLHAFACSARGGAQ